MIVHYFSGTDQGHDLGGDQDLHLGDLAQAKNQLQVRILL